MVLALRQIGPPMSTSMIIIVVLSTAFYAFGGIVCFAIMMAIAIFASDVDMWTILRLTIRAAFWPVTALVYIVRLLIEMLVIWYYERRVARSGN